MLDLQYLAVGLHLQLVWVKKNLQLYSVKTLLVGSGNIYCSCVALLFHLSICTFHIIAASVEQLIWNLTAHQLPWMGYTTNSVPALFWNTVVDLNAIYKAEDKKKIQQPKGKHETGSMLVCIIGLQWFSTFFICGGGHSVSGVALDCSAAPSLYLLRRGHIVHVNICNPISAAASSLELFLNMKKQGCNFIGQAIRNVIAEITLHRRVIFPCC